MWKGTEMNLRQYLDGIHAATTADELEAALQAPFRHPFHGRTWSAICKARIERGAAICAVHPNGRFVPRMDGRSLSVCGETYRVGRGYNSTGARYVWHSAGEFAKAVLKRNGLSSRAATRIWGCWGSYPHRCLALIDAATNGELADPKLNTLILSHMGTGPVKISVESNDADELDRRATLPCECGGTLFDWGAGFNDDFTFVNWHCNHCSRVFTEYVTADRFSAIRRPRVPLALET